MSHRHMRGFTIIELLVVVAIVLIISIIAVASFYPYLTKSKRADAVSGILAISLAEERYKSNNSTYGTLAQAYGGVTASPQGYYTMSVSAVSATDYTITATAVGNQANDKEGATSCTPMVFTMSSGTVTKTPAVCWPS